MAKAVIAKSGDTIDKMVSSRGVPRHELFSWRAKVRHLNPHIGDLNRIWPGDRVLLPGSLHEPVGQAWIWHNVFNAIPDHLKRPWNGNIALEITIGEASISSISRRAFADTADRNMSLNVQRAVFLVNNPGAQHYLHAKHLPAKRAFVSMPIVLSKFDAHYWQGEAQMFGGYISRFDPLTQEMYQEVGP